MAEEPVNDQYVSLYSLGSGNGSFDLANRLESKKTGEGEQDPGNAVFNFAQTHALTIVKKTTDASAMGQTFRFKVTRKASEDSPAETRMVEVKVSERRDEDGETWYVGSVQFAAPTGIYTVEEDTNWAWRYEGELSTPGKAPGKSAELTHFVCFERGRCGGDVRQHAREGQMGRWRLACQECLGKRHAEEGGEGSLSASGSLPSLSASSFSPASSAPLRGFRLRACWSTSLALARWRLRWTRRSRTT